MTEKLAKNRRTILKTLGGTAAGGFALAGVGTTAASDGWVSVETPIDGDVNDVVYASTGAFAVADGGIILERTDEGWQTVLQGGVGGNGNGLVGAAVTDDGDRLWAVVGHGRADEPVAVALDPALKDRLPALFGAFEDDAAVGDGEGSG